MSALPLDQKGFTLAELLVALGILGVITTFTIPKILVVQQNEQYKATAKEAASAIASAYQLYKQTGNLSASTTGGDFVNYFNNVRLDTTAQVDSYYGTSTIWQCSGANTCIRLHNGAVLLPTAWSFGGTNPTNAITFMFDPDGAYSSTTQTPAKSIAFWLYYNGRITSRDKITPNSCRSDGCQNPASIYDPPWFSW
ncbi:Tfp pilus assembly protein FimT/FimU [Vampirovibrio sp.]|uniref:pilus assembly FimT family protein n=1 Tax=Vampirovibrio sp. TaxID=2717857 RepID=UPI0035945B2A